MWNCKNSKILHTSDQNGRKLGPRWAPGLSRLPESSVRPSRIEIRAPEGFQLVKTRQNGPPKSPKIRSKIQGLSSSRGFLIARLGCTVLYLFVLTNIYLERKNSEMGLEVSGARNTYPDLQLSEHSSSFSLISYYVYRTFGRLNTICDWLIVK